MNDGSNGDQPVSRRSMLTGAALALGATAATIAIPRAAAEQKIDQATAQYQTTPRGGMHCEGCNSFQPPSACRFVQGDVSANGWCQLFTPKS
jgi:hypothetical protein